MTLRRFDREQHKDFETKTRRTGEVKCICILQIGGVDQLDFMSLCLITNQFIRNFGMEYGYHTNYPRNWANSYLVMRILSKLKTSDIPILSTIRSSANMSQQASKPNQN